MEAVQGETGYAQDIGVGIQTPVDFAKLFFNNAFFNLLSQHMEQKGESLEPPVECCTTAKELQGWLGVIIRMGLIQIKNQRAYWSKELRYSLFLYAISHIYYNRVPCVADVMSRNRFQLLQQCFTLHEPAEEGEKGPTPSERVSLLVDTMNEQFKKYYRPGVL